LGGLEVPPVPASRRRGRSAIAQIRRGERRIAGHYQGHPGGWYAAAYAGPLRGDRPGMVASISPTKIVLGGDAKDITLVLSKCGLSMAGDTDPI
jgi:hypothetical protein